MRTSTMSPTLAGRRDILLRVINTLIPKNRPLTDSERDSLRNAQAEMAELEIQIRADAISRAKAAFGSWLRCGLQASQWESGITEEERAALSVLTRAKDLERRDLSAGGQAAFPGSTAGFFVPMEFQKTVISAMKDVGCLLRTSTLILLPFGAPIAFPSDNDTTISGERVPENVQTTDVDIFTINATILGAFKYGSRLVKCSIEFLRDSGVDIDAWLAGRFGVRLGRITNTELLTGTDGGVMPNGLLNAAQIGATAAGSSPNDGSGAGTNTIGEQDLENLIGSVDPLYRNSDGAGFIVNDNVLTRIRKLTDKQGRPLKLYRSALENPSGQATLLGHPCFTHPGMPTLQVSPSSPAVTVKSVLFGDLSKYTVRYGPMVVYRIFERYAEYGLVGFFGLDAPLRRSDRRWGRCCQMLDEHVLRTPCEKPSSNARSQTNHNRRRRRNRLP